MKKETLFIEDLRVGQTFVSGEYHLTRENIIAFASAFDPQIFHLDAEKAEKTLFKGLAASGWHTAAVTMRLLVSSVPFGSGLIGLGGEIAWPQPARPGDVVHVVSEVLDIHHSRSKPDRGIVTALAETRNQRAEVLQTLRTKVVVFSKNSSLEGK